MADASAWKKLFVDWPAEMPRRGILMTAQGEQIPFAAFQTSDTMLLVERQTPDTLGARMVILSYESVAALKIVDVVKPAALRALGFAGPPAKR
jgi:hypothetical protein